MADLEETEEDSLCPKTDIEQYGVVTETFSCVDDVGAYVIENIESLDSADVTDAGFVDRHHLIVDSISDQNGHLVTSDGHLVTSDGHFMTADGQLFRLFKSSHELDASADSGSSSGQQTIILTGLPYSSDVLHTVKTEDDSDSLPTSCKKFCLEPERQNGYGVVFSVSAASAAENLVAGLKENDMNDDSEHLLNEDSNQSSASKDENMFGNPNEVSQSWFTTKGDKLALQSKGHQWKQGQWTKQEIDTLRKNIEQYCEERGIENAAEVIFDMTKDERKNFYRTIARGLQRPLFSVYRRVIRMYDRKNYIGKYTPEELSRLKELRKKHGSDWSTIGNVLGRSASSVKDRCRLMKDTCNTGKWYPEEERRLAEVVYRLSGASPGESVTSGLSWAQVAKHVNSRSEKQCRTKWLNYLNWKEKGGAEWTRDDDLLLLERLSEVSAKEEGDINWITIAADWPSARSPQWLHGKWWSMKRHISNYGQMPFPMLLQTVKSMNAQNKSRSPPVLTSATSLPGGAQCSGSIKLERLDYQNIQMIPGVTLTIPANMPIDGSLSAEIGDDDNLHAEGSGLQSYRLLEDVCDRTLDHQDESTYIVTESDTTSLSTVLTTNGLIPDSFVVQTLQSIGGQTNQNVVVEMTPAIQQIIIARDLHDDCDDSQLILSNHNQVFHQLDDIEPNAGHDTEKIGGHRILNTEELEQEEVISPLAIVINSEDLDVGSYVNDNSNCDHMEILTTNGFSEVIIESEIPEEIDDAHSLEADLVSLTSSHFVQLEPGDCGHSMSSFSDPMLITDNVDLLSSMSDGGKSQEAMDNIDQPSD